MITPGLSKIFGAPKPAPLPPPPPPPVTREDPAIAEAARRTRQAEQRRSGRRAAVLIGESSGEAPLGRPEAGSQKLG